MEPTSSELARKALITSGPALTLGHSVTRNGRSRSRPASSSWSCDVPSGEAIVSSVPDGTDVERMSKLVADLAAATNR